MLQLVVTKLKAALLVDSDRTEGLAALDIGGRAVHLSWSGLEISTMKKPSRTFQQLKITEEVPKLKITKVKVKGGASSLLSSKMCSVP